MIERTAGVVLRVRPLTETSLIVQWLTRDFGRMSTVAKGARRPKSTFRGKLDLFYMVEFSFRRSRQSDLHTLAEVNLLETHPVIRQDIYRLQQASYCVELLELITEADTPIPMHYASATTFLDEVAGHPPDPRTVLSLEFRLLQESGLMPDLRTCGLSEGSTKAALVLTEGSWAFIRNLRLTNGQVRELADFLAVQWLAALPRAPRSRDGALRAGYAARQQTPGG